jgi:hypothetical protein
VAVRHLLTISKGKLERKGYYRAEKSDGVTLRAGKTIRVDAGLLTIWGISQQLADPLIAS